MSEKQCVNMSGEKENDMITERNVIATGADDGRTATEYGHDLTFRCRVPMSLPCSRDSGLLSGYKAVFRCCNHRSGCPDKGMLPVWRLVTLFRQTDEKKKQRYNNPIINPLFEKRMSKRCVFIALSNQKGGVGKSTLTVLLASYFHYVKGRQVAVVDCDYPQHSIQALRTRDTQSVEKSEYLQRLLCEQFERTGKKAYPVLTSGPGKVLETAGRLEDSSEIVFFDLPGTVNSPGILEAIINMDYLFAPVIQDRMVMQSSLSFVATLQDFVRKCPEAPLKEIRLFWNRIDGRVSREIYRHYNGIFGKIGLRTLDTVMPDMERYNREAASGSRPLFRSTYFPPSDKLLKGSGLDLLADEIESIVYSKP